MNEEKNEVTLKERVKKFIDEYGFILPMAIGLTALNTLSLAKANKKVKIQEKNIKDLRYDIDDLTMTMADQHCEILTIHRAINK